MTKKHFEAIARVLAARMAQHPISDSVSDAVARTEIREVASAIADVCAAENPRFDKTRFMSAAGCI